MLIKTYAASFSAVSVIASMEANTKLYYTLSLEITAPIVIKDFIYASNWTMYMGKCQDYHGLASLP